MPTSVVPLPAHVGECRKRQTKCSAPAVRAEGLRELPSFLPGAQHYAGGAEGELGAVHEVRDLIRASAYYADVERWFELTGWAEASEWLNVELSVDDAGSWMLYDFGPSVVTKSASEGFGSSVVAKCRSQGGRRPRKTLRRDRVLERTDSTPASPTARLTPSCLRATSPGKRPLIARCRQRHPRRADRGHLGPPTMLCTAARRAEDAHG